MLHFVHVWLVEIFLEFIIVHLIEGLSAIQGLLKGDVLKEFKEGAMVSYY